MLARRKLIGGLGLLIAAPAVIRVAQLMPVKAFDPYADGIWISLKPYIVIDNPSITFSWSALDDPTNRLPARQVRRADGSPLQAGDLKAGSSHTVDLQTGLLTPVTL